MAPPATPVTLNLGFLTVLHETNGYLGGYLVTNNWGRPLEFRLSTAVQPNRIHQILYGGTLEAYLCADLIGKTLIEKTATPIQLLLTESELVLDVRLKVPTPALWLVPVDHARAGELAAGPTCVRPPGTGRGALVCHPRAPEDVTAGRELLERLEGLDLSEPFQRIREAIGEARKMGVGNRAA
jgi:hypothetical protein